MKRQTAAELPWAWMSYDTANMGDKMPMNSSGSLQLNPGQMQESFYPAIIQNSSPAAQMSSSACSTRNEQSISSKLQHSCFDWSVPSQFISHTVLPSPTSSLECPTPTKKQRIHEHLEPFESTHAVSVQSFNYKKPITKLQSCCGPSQFELGVLLTTNEWDATTQNAFWMYKSMDNGQEFAFTRSTSLLFEQLYNKSSHLNLALKMRLPETEQDHLVNLKTMEMTDFLTGEKFTLLRKSVIPNAIESPALGSCSTPFPAQWAAQANDIAVITLSVYSDEYIAIKERFLRTMPGTCILRIERIQNKNLYIRYAFQKAMILDKNFGNEEKVNEKLLFHGTSDTSPSTVWQSQDGFDFRYCHGGMWGIGTYFAENASYSDKYAYRPYTLFKNKYQASEMFVAHVLTGNSIEMKSTKQTKKLTRPPTCVAATSTNSEVLYDSVTGFTSGSRIYVVYKLDMAYPSYLVRYCKRDVEGLVF